MKNTELRIGNSIIYNYNENGLIEAEFKTVVNVQILKSLEDGTAYAKPIPLDEEWHNKFGVKVNGFQSFEYELPRKNNQQITVVFNGDYVMLRQATSNKKHEDDIVSIWNTDLTRRDMFVHEWQNLYFALTNEELTIK